MLFPIGALLNPFKESGHQIPRAKEVPNAKSWRNQLLRSIEQLQLR